MKKFCVCVILMVLFSKIEALPIGNPCDGYIFREEPPALFSTPCINARFGFYGDYVFERKLRRHLPGNFAAIHKTTISTNAALLAMNICNRWDIFGALGASHFYMETSASRATSSLFLFESGTGFTWTLGTKGIIWQRRHLFLGTEAQYFYSAPPINYLKQVNNVNISYSKRHLHYREWQIGLALVYQLNPIFKDLVPMVYMGGKYSKAQLTNLGNLRANNSLIAEGLTLNTLRNQRDWGLAFGCTLRAENRVSLNLELRFLDEKAFAINNQYRF